MSKALTRHKGATDNNFPALPLTPNLTADIPSIDSNSGHNSCESSAGLEFTGFNELSNQTDPVSLPHAFDNGEVAAPASNNVPAPVPPPAPTTVAAPPSMIDPMMTQDAGTAASAAMMPPSPRPVKSPEYTPNKPPSLVTWVSGLAQLNTTICAYRPGYEVSNICGFHDSNYAGAFGEEEKAERRR